MKMTTEQFLSQLGIEVGQEFIADENNCVVNIHFELSVSDGVETIYKPLEWLLDKEITILPKYTLTKDEKVIVRQKYIYGETLLKRKSDFVVLLNNDRPIMFIEKNMFPFIKEQESLPIEELRKCL